MSTRAIPTTQWQAVLQMAPSLITEQRRITTNAILSVGEGGNGELGAADTAILSVLAYAAPKGDAFEFGTYLGRTTRLLALARPDSTVFTIDCHNAKELCVERGQPGDIPFCGIPRESIGRAFGGTSEATRIIQLWGDSLNYPLQDLYGAMGIVFVDGGHDYATVLSDLQRAYNMLADQEAGIVVAHDYGFVPDVTKAWNEVFAGMSTLSFEASRLVAYGAVAQELFG